MKLERLTFNRRFIVAMAIGLFLLLVFAVVSLRLGAVPTPFGQLLDDLRSRSGIVYDYRLPRLLIAIMVGMNMAVAGSILQGITRNPLAAPDLIGISAGGGIVIVVMILLVPNFSAAALPVYSFCGAAAAGAIVYAIAYRKDGMTHDTLALSGIAVGSGLQALVSLLLVKYTPNAAQALTFLKGSLYARSWLHVQMIAPWTLIGIPVAFYASRYLMALLFDEITVKGLGVRTIAVRLFMLVLVVALAGSSVAVAGTIGFVGLVVPHMVRFLVGPDYRKVIPLSALLGALLVVLADTVGRTIMPPMEVPAGIITALLGAPYFIYLLLKRFVRE